VKDVFWIEGEPNAALAIVLRPRGNDWLEDELIRIKQSGVQVLVSMLEGDEAESLGLSDERKLAESNGLSFISFPIPDRTTPAEISSFNKFVADIAIRLRAGERVGVHCRGSIGRACIAAACALVQLGWPPAQALVAIEKARGCAVPDTDQQREWIMRYEAVV
jgi:protein-tyrosine phosphatase